MSTKSALVGIVLAVAAVATLTGAALLIDFDSAPGPAPQAPASWPQTSKVSRASGERQIVVIAHPQCGCTEATLEELSHISGATISVLFYRPNSKMEWPRGRTWQQVDHVKGATARWDDAGREAKLFGSSTSGSVLLYGRSGELLFHGGITAARGHTGENRGLSELKLALRTGLPNTVSTPVFGCSLLSSGMRS